MSFFTQLPVDSYVADAVRGLALSADFDLATARSLAWMSQLSYETDPDKIATVCGKLDIGLVGAPIHRRVGRGLPLASTHALVLDFGDALVVAFAGTDPVHLANGVSDFDIRQTDGGATAGFTMALRAVEQDILSALPTGRPVMVTGHSLGGALAVLFAQWLETMGRHATAVYTYGAPRPGRRDFSEPYNASDLGARTFRCVHGDDIVPTVAPSEPLGFRHVGRFVHAPTGGKFLGPVGAAGVDLPAFAKGIADELSAVFHNPRAVAGAFMGRLRSVAGILAGKPPAGRRNELAGITIEMLPARVRHHLPDQYIAACS
ncbi:MAG TPA: lipase family protein [Stellaceae bacterium]|nr:lipase family protein [Stellaceae bacterium]